jgi:predicted nuclease of predicted toxin-antitoxin system
VIRFAADENLNDAITRGLRRRQAAIDIVRVQDAGLSGADDRTILQWAAEQGRVLLTHDVSTMTKYAYERSTAASPCRASSRSTAPRRSLN